MTFLIFKQLPGKSFKLAVALRVSITKPKAAWCRELKSTGALPFSNSRE
jgi:hypothetical protein